MMLVALNIAKSSLMCQKSPKWMLFLCFKAGTPFSKMKSANHLVYSRLEAINEVAAVPKVQHHGDKPKKRRQTNKQKTKLTGMQNLKIQKIQF